MAARSTNLTTENMGLPSKILFTILFFMMGFSIVGAGLTGQEPTAPIIISIGVLMVFVGLAPWYMSIIYSKYVTQKIKDHPETKIV